MTARPTSAKPCRNAEPSANQLLSPPSTTKKSSPTMNTHGMLGKDDSSIRHYGGAEALKTLTIRYQSILCVQKRSVVPSSPQLRCSIHRRDLLFPSINLSLVHQSRLNSRICALTPFLGRNLILRLFQTTQEDHTVSAHYSVRRRSTILPLFPLFLLVRTALLGYLGCSRLWMESGSLPPSQAPGIRPD
jgi:hypothetical protein